MTETLATKNDLEPDRLSPTVAADGSVDIHPRDAASLRAATYGDGGMDPGLRYVARYSRRGELGEYAVAGHVQIEQLAFVAFLLALPVWLTHARFGWSWPTLLVAAAMAVVAVVLLRHSRRSRPRP